MRVTLARRAASLAALALLLELPAACRAREETWEDGAGADVEVGGGLPGRLVEVPASAPTPAPTDEPPPVVDLVGRYVLRDEDGQELELWAFRVAGVLCVSRGFPSSPVACPGGAP